MANGGSATPATRAAKRKYHVLEPHSFGSADQGSAIPGFLDRGLIEAANADDAITDYVATLPEPEQKAAIGTDYVAIAESGWNEATFEAEIVTVVKLRHKKSKSPRKRKAAATSNA